MEVHSIDCAIDDDCVQDDEVHGERLADSSMTVGVDVQLPVGFFRE